MLLVYSKNWSAKLSHTGLYVAKKKKKNSPSVYRFPIPSQSSHKSIGSVKEGTAGNEALFSWTRGEILIKYYRI